MRFHSAPVVRLADAKPMQLGHAARADGAWRLYAFADAGPRTRVPAARRSPSSWRSPELAASPLHPGRRGHRRVIDVRAVFQQGHRELDVDELPSLLLPRKGRFGLIDYEKVFCPDLKARRGHLRPARHRPRAGRAGRRAPRPVRRPRAAARRLYRAGLLLRPAPSDGIGAARLTILYVLLTTLDVSVDYESRCRSARSPVRRRMTTPVRREAEPP